MGLLTSLPAMGTNFSIFTLRLGELLHIAEDAIRLPGKIPVVGMSIATQRASLAPLQVFTGFWNMVFSTISAFASMFTEKVPGSIPHLLQFEIGLHMMVHGWLNAIRAPIEFLPVINSLILFPYDAIVGGQLLTYIPGGKIPAWVPYS